MPTSINRFHLFARLVGGLLTFSALGLFAVFGVFLVSGTNVLAPDLALDAGGMVILATVGAFQLPLGLSLLGRDSRTTFRLRVASVAIGLMAFLRLLAFVNPEVRAVLGVTPLIEAGFFGVLAAIALVIRPQSESAIEIMRVFEIDAPAASAWDLLANRFGDVALYASGVRAASVDGPVGVGCTRTCTSEPFGPFASADVTERLVEFDPQGMGFTYVAGGELPAFIPSSRNRWKVEVVGSDTCRVWCHASVDLLWWATPFAPALAASIARAVDTFGADLRGRLVAPAADPVSGGRQVRPRVHTDDG